MKENSKSARDTNESIEWKKPQNVRETPTMHWDTNTKMQKKEF